MGSGPAEPRIVRLVCSVSHTFWNGRIEEIRPLILWGLRRLLSEGFCNSADAVVGVVEDLAGFDGEPALEEEIVVDLTQLFPDLGVAELLGIAAAGQTEQGGERRPESKSRRLVQATFSWAAGACSWSTRWMVVRETR